MSEASPITVERLTLADDETMGFLLASYREVFAGRIDSSQIPRDLQGFTYYYGLGRGCLLLARNAAGEAIGSLAYRPYDRRFPQLAYPGERVVEVVRLYVAPRYRRQGLARRLFAALLAHAARDRAQRLYLHTHPFLPGAEAFWLGQGFAVVERETALPWQTLHLDRWLGDER